MDVTAAHLELFATLPDPRSKQGQGYPLPAVPGPAVVAMLAGMTSPEAGARFGRPLGPPSGFKGGKSPGKTTPSRASRGVGAGPVEEAPAA